LHMSPCGIKVLCHGISFKQILHKNGWLKSLINYFYRVQLNSKFVKNIHLKIFL
jgi:hypothetical protein